MLNSHRLTPYAAGVVLTAALLVVPACKQQEVGRIDPYQTTQSDLAAPGANIPAMLEFTDLTAQRLAGELASIPQIQDQPGKQVLELGSIENRTRTRTTDFELIQRRLRSQLMRSDVVRNNFIVVEGRQRMDMEADRVVGDTAPTARYSPDETYVLQGDFYEMKRGERSQFFFNFKLTNVGTREIVFDSDFDLAQVRATD